ncbi:hypothetical protein ACGC1H_003422 [Rhizoctonia solani]
MALFLTRTGSQDGSACHTICELVNRISLARTVVRSSTTKSPASPIRDPVGLPPTADCGYASTGMSLGGGYYLPGKGRDTRGEREVDLTGLTFDRTGRWMYVGTERTVVEFEMVPRRGRTYDAAEWA